MRELIQMLKSYEIKNIISIDDMWEPSGEKIEEKIMGIGLDSDITVKEFCSQYDIEILKEEIEAYNKCQYNPVKSMKEEEIPELFSEISAILEVDSESALKTLESVLDQLENEFNVYKGVSFESDYYKLSGNTLYILDKDMGEKRENEFLDYILSITDERKAYNDLVIVYSNEVAGLLEHDKKVKYLEQNNEKGKDLEVLYQFWPLSKVTDVGILVSGMKEMISKSVYGKALSKMIEMKKLSIEKAFKDLLHIDMDNLDDMIIESYIEGGKFTESYELLIDSLIKKNLLKQIMETDVLNYEKGLLQYSEKRSKEIMEERDISSKKQYNSLRTAVNKKKLLDSGTLVYNIADYSINKEYNNPSMGDIYVFTEAKSKKKYAGMLISQECSIVIRMIKYPDDIKRKADELLLLLFDIVEITEENTKGIIQNLDECIWPIKIDEKVCLLKNTKRSMYINSEILDLCGLNIYGKANIQIEKEALEYKSTYSRKYYKKIQERVEKKIKETVLNVVQMNEIAGIEDSIKNMIVSLAYGVIFDGNFELERICKIDDKQTLHIIHEYLNSIAKIGLQVIPNL